MYRALHDYCIVSCYRRNVLAQIRFAKAFPVPLSIPKGRYIGFLGAFSEDSDQKVCII